MTALDERTPALAEQLAKVQAERDELRAAFHARSHERDRWHRAALDYWADGYRAGYEAGAEVGYARAAEDWKVVHGMSVGGPTHAELDRRRYPPNGRQSWIIQ